MDKQTIFSGKKKLKKKIKKAKKGKLKDVENDTQTVFCTVTQMKKENKDMVGEKKIPGNSGRLAYSAEKKAWKQRYERLLNVELPWWEKDLSEADPVLGTTPVITQGMVEKSIVRMKKRQST